MALKSTQDVLVGEKSFDKIYVYELRMNSSNDPFNFRFLTHCCKNKFMFDYYL